MLGAQFANQVVAHKWHAMNLDLLSPLHKQVGCCCYPYTKKKNSAAFQKKGFVVTTVQLEESMIEFKTVFQHM